jgi:hypothetical protein
MHQSRSAARRAFATAVVSVALVGLPSHLLAQTATKTKAQRDSAAKADSIKHAGHNMPGMTMPVKPAASATKKPAATTSQKAPTKTEPKSAPAAPKTAAKTGGAVPDRSVPVTKDMPGMTMPTMKDSSAMPAKPMSAMRDTAMSAAAHDSMMKAMAGRDSVGMKSMMSRDTSAMKAMTSSDSTAMKSMAGMHDSTRAKSDTMHQHADSAAMPGMKQHADSSQMQGMQMGMTAEPLGVSMDRMGSGTTWIPDAVKLPSYHAMAGSWDLMLHGFVFGQYNKQGGPRGDEQFGSLNWGMFMASRELSGGRFQVRTMLSLDPATVTPKGYPLLLQSGETYQGQPLVDRQHPHDFWMELGAMYERALTTNVGFMVYGAPSGEPALGPVAFMHRPSAMDNPFAPLSHHWQDATHVSFGVATAGLFTNKWRLEGSIFNGREPDEFRWNFDPIKFDSYSGRATFNPDSSWSFTAGYGWMKSPEILSPSEGLHRLTASALHGMKIGDEGQVATAVIWGANAHHGAWSHSVLVESEAVLDRSNTLLMRAEYVQKNAEELVLDGAPYNLASELRLNVATVSAGYIRELARVWGTTIGLGGMGTVNLVPSSIESIYGSRTPVGGVVFLRLRPQFKRAAMAGMGHAHE